MSPLSVALLSREYPPEMYGGAGVHVKFLVRALTPHVGVKVHCFGAVRSAPEVARSYQPWSALDGKAPHLAALRTMSVDLEMAAAVEGASLVHTHTWYANFAGYLAKLMYKVPHVVTSHSLEPLRPWKEEQLAGGYRISSFCERVSIESADAVIAVSKGMKQDILTAYPSVSPDRVVVIYNGVDSDEYRPNSATSALDRHGIDPKRPYAVFVGRITRQKGVLHLLHAARHFEPGIGLVLCAGEPDTPEIGAEVRAKVAELEAERGHVVWIENMLPREELSQILTHAAAFVCPSVYEPFGIVNLEAMACGTPVVASNVGGIPEIVVDGQTGYLVDYELDNGAPRDPDAVARRLAERVNELSSSPDLCKRLGDAARERAVGEFSWTKIGEQTAALYRRLCGS